MAKKKKKVQEDQPGKKILDHISSMSLWDIDSYYRWCLENNFTASFSKSSQEISEERQHFIKLNLEREIYLTIDKNPKKLIEKACDGQIDHTKIDRPFWEDFAKAICTSKDENKVSLKELLLFLQKKACFLFSDVKFGNHKYLYIDAVIKINDRRGLWLNELATWKPGSHNARRQFSSLVRHLFCKYEIPEFFDSAWFRKEKGSYKFRDWFTQIGLGKNIRTLNTPIPLTKKMAHSMMQAPSHYSIENAIRWGQIHAMGGDERLIAEINATRLGKNFVEEKFWSTFINFFIQNPMLDRKHVGPVFDFIYHQKYKIDEVIVGEGQVERRPPPQPNFSMTNRDPESLLRQVDEWHGVLNKVEPAKNLYFRKSEIKELHFTKGRKEELAIFRLKQLLSGRALIDEGKAMSHCVASYAYSCYREKCTIWSLEKEHKGVIEKCLTVEVDKDDIIVQARGKRNRLPNSGEINLLNRWAKENNLVLSHYISSMD